MFFFFFFNQTLHTLQSQVGEARSAAAQVISAIAQIELPSGQWPDLITTLLNNMNQPNDFLRQASLMSLGYICEEIVRNKGERERKREREIEKEREIFSMKKLKKTKTITTT